MKFDGNCDEFEDACNVGGGLVQWEFGQEPVDLVVGVCLPRPVGEVSGCDFAFP